MCSAGAGSCAMKMVNHYALRQEVTSEDLNMSQQSKVQEKPGQSKNDSPDPQVVLDLLTSWIEFALNCEMNIEQLYSPKNGRFTVRIYDVQMDGDQLVAVPKEGE